MNDRWDRIGRLFEEALAVSAAERAALLSASAEPDDIKNEVRSLARRARDVGRLSRSTRHAR